MNDKAIPRDIEELQKYIDENNLYHKEYRFMNGKLTKCTPEIILDHLERDDMIDIVSIEIDKCKGKPTYSVKIVEI